MFRILAKILLVIILTTPMKQHALTTLKGLIALGTGSTAIWLDAGTLTPRVNAMGVPDAHGNFLAEEAGVRKFSAGAGIPGKEEIKPYVRIIITI